MKDERSALREYFDAQIMTAEFRQKLLSLPQEPDASPKALLVERRWQPMAIAAALIFICLAGIPLLRRHETVSPAVSTALPETAATQQVSHLPTHSPEIGTEPIIPVSPTVPVTSESETDAPTESAPATVPPLSTDSTVITAPTIHATEPSVPATEPSVPATEPSVPATEPTVPATEPTVPATEPSVPVTEPSVPVTEPTVPATEPTVSDPEPPAPEGPDEIPAEDLGWVYEVLRTETGDRLCITDAAGAVCILDLTDLPDNGELLGDYLIFGQEQTILLIEDPDGAWKLFVLLS